MAIKFKKSFYIFLGVLILLPLLMGCSPKEGQALSVNKSYISIEEFEREFQLYRDEYVEQYGEDILSRETEDGILQEDILKKEVLEKLVKEELILSDATKEGVEISPAELEEEIFKYKTRLGGEEGLKRFMERKALSLEEIEEGIKKQALIDKYRSKIQEGMEVSQEEAKKFFEDNKEDIIQVRARHILVLSEEEAQDILRRLEAGEDFERLALEKSKHTSTAGNGGDLGYFTKADLIRELVDIAFDLEVGDISPIVETEIGYHIIKVLDRKDDFESLSDHAIKVLKDQRYEERVLNMESKAKVKVLIKDIPRLKYEKKTRGLLGFIFNIFNK